MNSHIFTPTKPTPFKPLSYTPVFSTLKPKSTVGFSASAFRNQWAATGLKCRGKEGLKVTCAMESSDEVCDLRALVLGGTHEDTFFRIQVNTGSTLNILSRSLAKEFGCKLTAITPFPHTFADGFCLECSFMCEGFCWEMDGRSYEADFLVADLGLVDMVLGVEWLAPLGDISFDFQDRTMMFELQGTKHSLKLIK